VAAFLLVLILLVLVLQHLLEATALKVAMVIIGVVGVLCLLQVMAGVVLIPVQH
jgi:hypothetical protein